MNYAYQEGFDEGYRKGYEDGMNALQERMVLNMIKNAEPLFPKKLYERCEDKTDVSSEGL